MKKTWTTALLSIALYSGASLADYGQLTTEYGSFKNMDYQDNEVRNIFVSYFNQMQNNDMDYLKNINKLNNKYQEKLVKTKRAIAYRTDEEQAKRLKQVYKDEEKNYKKIAYSFNTNEMKIVNQFIRNIKSSRIDVSSKRIILENISPLLSKYKSTQDMKSAMEQGNNLLCFKPQLKGQGISMENYCETIYDRNYELNKNLKTVTMESNKELLTKYFIDSTKSNFLDNLNKRIELIQKEEKNRY